MYPYEKLVLSPFRRFKIDIGLDGTKAVCKGVMMTICTISENITSDMLEDLYSAYKGTATGVLKSLVHGKDKSGLYGLNRVNVGFLLDLLDIYLKYAPIMKQNLV